MDEKSPDINFKDNVVDLLPRIAAAAQYRDPVLPFMTDDRVPINLREYKRYRYHSGLGVPPGMYPVTRSYNGDRQFIQPPTPTLSSEIVGQHPVRLYVVRDEQ
jgi:hypothetical protein